MQLNIHHMTIASFLFSRAPLPYTYVCMLKMINMYIYIGSAAPVYMCIFANNQMRLCINSVCLPEMGLLCLSSCHIDTGPSRPSRPSTCLKHILWRICHLTNLLYGSDIHVPSHHMLAWLVLSFLESVCSQNK